MSPTSSLIRIKFVPIIILLFVSIIGISEGFTEPEPSRIPITSPQCNEFTFDATGSFDPDNDDLSFLWEFGDGHFSYEPFIMHKFDKSGDYVVRLTITDDSNVQNSAATTTQTVKANIPPFSIINVPEKVCIEETVDFDGSGSYDDIDNSLTYRWDFGDGSAMSTEKIAKKSYVKPGLFKIGLTVDDNSQTVCSSHTSEKYLFVNAPPKADTGHEEILKCFDRNAEFIVAFDGTNSSDANGDPLSFKWDFDDGTSFDGIKTHHQFKDIGNYDVKLLVSDAANTSCSKSIDFVKVRLNIAPVADAGEDVKGCVGDNVIFDGSKSYIHQKGTDSSKWFFGDGTTGSGLNVQHTYSKPGKYQASLTIENNLNSSCPPSRDAKLVLINSEPTVSIQSKDIICLGESIQLDASSAIDPDGDDLEFYWSFGDGAILKAGPVVNHDFKHGGEYRVTVIVDDKNNSNCSTATAEKMIKVNTPPIADPGANLACCVNTAATFSATGSSDPDGNSLSYQWDFGDGTQNDGAVVEHTYQKSGSYSVTLTVDDNTGTSCSKSSSGYVAKINAQPIPKINVR